MAYRLPGLAILVGSLLGAAAVALWFETYAYVYEFLAINRFADDWPGIVRTAAPIAIFGTVILAPSYYLFTRLGPNSGRAAIVVATVGFVLLRAGALLEIGTSWSDWGEFTRGGIVVCAMGALAWWRLRLVRTRVMNRH
jgi:hypothetical protein